MGRLTWRAASDQTDFEIVQCNDPAGDAETFAHLLNFDSVHGTWDTSATAEGNTIIINGVEIPHTQNKAIEDTDWSTCDVVIDASGKFKSQAKLAPFFEQGVKKVIVTAPVKEEGVLDAVYGINHELYNKEQHQIVTAASCTTNCLAPVVKVIHENFGIKHGSMTTIHDITNTQTILDAPRKDLRRSRACGMSLIPTTTGSATAITHIFPELKGKLNGHAVRVPLANASITDCVFELNQAVDENQVNNALKQAANGELEGILQFEERPLVSIDFRTNPHSSIVDAPSTMVVNGTQVKLYLWYDNEWGYANRVADLTRYVIAQGL
jgi:glyceraldehyde 3-phosphate dehydrogenase